MSKNLHVNIKLRHNQAVLSALNKYIDDYKIPKKSNINIRELIGTLQIIMYANVWFMTLKVFLSATTYMYRLRKNRGMMECIKAIAII